jgi:hypothetical protein
MPQEYRDLNDLIAGLMQTTRQELLAAKQRKVEGQQQQLETQRYEQKSSTTAEQQAFENAMKEAEFELEQDYKRSQMNKKADEKPLTLDQLIGKTAQGQMEAGQLDLNGLIELKRKIANKTGGGDSLNRQTLGKAQNAFLEGRAKVPETYETTDEFGLTSQRVRFNDSPLTGGTLDTLTAIGRGDFPQGQASPDTIGFGKQLGTQNIQGLPPMYDERTMAAIQALRAEYPDFDSAPPEVRQAAIKKKLSGF